MFGPTGFRLGKVESGGAQLWIDWAVLSNQNRAMKISLLTSVMVAGLAAVALGSPAETELKALEQQWSDAYVKGDTAALKTIEADDCITVEPDGTLITKAQDIKSVGDKTFVVKTATLSDLKVRMLGDNHGCVTGVTKLTGTDEGKDISGDYRFMDIFEKKDGKWQAVASQVTKIKKEKE
jgi:ketosteroid isomerase-like protein